MTNRDKLKHCVGCHDDYYNCPGNSPDGVCWSLKSMKLVWRKQVHIDQRPPWTQKSKLMPDCYHAQRYVFVKPDQTC